MQKCQKVAVLKPQSSQYGVLHHFTQKLFEAFTRKELNCHLLSAENALEHLAEFLPHLAVSFNGGPQDSEGNFLCDRLQKPHLSILADAPYYYYTLLKSLLRRIACVDRFNFDLLNPLHLSPALFFPHTVEAEIFTEGPCPKSIDILMLASLIDHKQRVKKWKSLFPSFLVRSIESAAEMTFVDSFISYIETFHSEVNREIKRGGIYNLQEIPFFTVFREIELCIKGKGCIALLQALKEHAVHLFCSTEDALYWKKALKKKARLIFHPSISYTASFNVMRKSKVVLNSSPHIKRGGQERIFAGFAYVPVWLLQRILSYLKTLPTGKNSFLYKPMEPNLLSQDLQNEALRYNMAENGRRKILQRHT